MNPQKPYDQPNAITLLSRPGVRMTKLVTPRGKAPAQNPHDSKYAYDVELVDGIKDLDGFIAWLRSQTDTHIVRGAPREGIPALVNRTHRKQSDPDKTSEAFVEVRRSWVMFDIDPDKSPFEMYDGWQNSPNSAVRAAMEALLPVEFHAAACVVHFSSSMAYDSDKLNAHLFFWLDRPLDNAELKQWFADLDLDKAVFTPSQPHYTADPVFRGMTDPLLPLPRQLLLPGVSKVPVPHPLPQPKKKRPTRADGSTRASDYSSWEEALDAIGDDLHVPIRDFCMFYISSKFPNVDKEAARQMVIDRCRTQAAHRSEADIEERTGRGFDHNWDTAYERVEGELLQENPIAKAMAARAEKSATTQADKLFAQLDAAVAARVERRRR